MAAAKFQERVAIVTGTRGMGRAIAVAMAANGASVVAVDREPEFAEAAADAVIANGGSAIPVTADVGREEDVERFVETTVTNFGRIDFLVATAAIQFFDVGTVVDTTPEQWEQTLRVNLTGVYFCSRSCIPHMAAQGGGAIVAISSDCSIRTCVNSAAYVASKSGLNGLVRALAVDHGHQGIRANIIIPGVTDTPGLLVAYGSGGRNLEASLAKVAALSPLGRVGHAEDIANAAVFLCSDDSSFVTGSELFVDGGMTVTYGAE